MPPAALLDVDGTLVDSNYQHVIAWDRAFRDHGVVVPLWHLHRTIGMGGDGFVAAVTDETVERSLGDDLRAAHREAFASELGRVAPLPGAHDLLATLLGAGSAVVLCSSAEQSELDVYLDLLGVRGRVETTTSADVDATKPAPDLVGVALDRAGGGPAVMVGDTVWDVAAASKVGVPTIGLLSGGVGAGELSAAGAVQIYSGADDLCARLSDTPLSPSPSSDTAFDWAAFSDRA
jgi:HAD superfamily hydrolase (TIGR01509 family)